MMNGTAARLLCEAIHTQEPVIGLTHDFYKYPARFSPLFTRAAIQSFTGPGDIVYDPFMGGGTTVVEASCLGRKALGTDISSLAVFLSDVKTTVLLESQTDSIRAWIRRVLPNLSIWKPSLRAVEWAEMGYQRNINSRETWRIRKLIELAVAEIAHLQTPGERRFARCVILRTAQWALDCRKNIPAVEEFRHQFRTNARAMLKGAVQYRCAIRETMKSYGFTAETTKPLCLHRSAVGVEQERDIDSYRPIKLVLTSPPYPGVHVLYHRWQVRGRRETPAPFWITESRDGQGSSYYTFGDRKAHELRPYFDHALGAFRSIAKIINRETIIVQMVAFAEPEWQLDRYAAMMKHAGFDEIKFAELANEKDGRVWRSVPNRKWYASQLGTTPGSREVVLFHKLSADTRALATRRN
jgi:DNA modification methylase